MPNGQSDTSADMIFKVSGEIKDTDNGQIYKIDSGNAYQSLLFISDEKYIPYLLFNLLFLKTSISMHINKMNLCGLMLET